MNICIGSKNPTKVDAVKDIFPEANLIALEVPSNVPNQPFSDEETRRGAINRALHSRESHSDAIGIGLEGGVMYVGKQLYLCNWGALVDVSGHIYTASGARVVLPIEIDNELKTGKELGDIMDEYARRQDVRKNEGAIGIFTNDLISRKEMFTHVVKMLKGQMEYGKVNIKNSSN
ncbi:DUF84 family protein [Oceanobacillus piezotolerans]|uniref:inosine/xanthosine triphosphatase n=1 Tax=Oceanobacillus piezotolerans TaxID=2448030 RepID=A0A498DBK3_9BACI|nr:DUF84 family protein [Oceanobacillus piezotolerans]RLL48514.1 DUF84 family protein [Oceanobacillus piezotolerans]